MQDKGTLGVYDSLACIGEGSQKPSHLKEQVMTFGKVTCSYPFASSNTEQSWEKEIRGKMLSPSPLIKREPTTASTGFGSISNKSRESNVDTTFLVTLKCPGLRRPSQVPASKYDKKVMIRQL